MGRTLCWFSCGAASAVATKLIIAEILDAEILYCDTGGEHEDNVRFLADCERWYGRTIKVLRNPKYKDHFDVVEKNRYIGGPMGAKCSGVLKRDLRVKYQTDSDVHVFGFTSEETERAHDFEDRNRDLAVRWPLIESKLSKQDCLSLLSSRGIDIPAMYKLGYKNNNCIGCVKGGIGYWNKIRRDFPDHFRRMAGIERKIGHTVLKSNSRPIFLDTIPPHAGNYEAEMSLECGVFCQAAGTC